MNISHFLRFALGGMLIFIYELGVTVFLTEKLHLWHMYSFALALLSGLFLLFLYHYKITFQSHFKATDLLKFIVVYCSTYLLAWIFLLLATQFSFHYIPSITVISLFISLLNYYANKYLVFNQGPIS